MGAADGDRVVDMMEKVKKIERRARDTDGRFKSDKGVNCDRRTKKRLDLGQNCRDMTPEALEQIGIVLREGKEADRLKAAGMILAYGWGRAPQTVNLNHSGEIGASLFDPEKRQAIIDAAIERLRAAGAGTGKLRE
jgi:hypothetical protein